MPSSLRIFLFAALISLPLTAAAQLAPFIGTWEYRTDSTCFRLQLLTSPDFRLPDGTISPEPVLLGRYSFTRRNVVVEETYSAPRAAYPFVVLHLGYETWGEVMFRSLTGQTAFSAYLSPNGYPRPGLLWTRQRWPERPRPATTPPDQLALPDIFTLTRVE